MSLASHLAFHFALTPDFISTFGRPSMRHILRDWRDGTSRKARKGGRFASMVDGARPEVEEYKVGIS